jgi:hypothetical protein
MGNVVLAVVIIASGVIGLVVVVALFVWGAVKDGEDNDAAQDRIRGRKPS